MDEEQLPRCFPPLGMGPHAQRWMSDLRGHGPLGRAGGAGHLTLHPKAKLLALPFSPPHLPQTLHSPFGADPLLCGRQFPT